MGGVIDFVKVREIYRLRMNARMTVSSRAITRITVIKSCMYEDLYSSQSLTLTSE